MCQDQSPVRIEKLSRDILAVPFRQVDLDGEGAGGRVGINFYLRNQWTSRWYV